MSTESEYNLRYYEDFYGSTVAEPGAADDCEDTSDSSDDELTRKTKSNRIRGSADYKRGCKSSPVSNATPRKRTSAFFTSPKSSTRNNLSDRQTFSTTVTPSIQRSNQGAVLTPSLTSKKFGLFGKNLKFPFGDGLTSPTLSNLPASGRKCTMPFQNSTSVGFSEPTMSSIAESAVDRFQGDIFEVATLSDDLEDTFSLLESSSQDEYTFGKTMNQSSSLPTTSIPYEETVMESSQDFPSDSQVGEELELTSTSKMDKAVPRTIQLFLGQGADPMTSYAKGRSHKTDAKGTSRTLVSRETVHTAASAASVTRHRGHARKEAPRPKLEGKNFTAPGNSVQDGEEEDKDTQAQGGEEASNCGSKNAQELEG